MNKGTLWKSVENISKTKYHEAAPVHILFLILKHVGVTSPLGAQHIQPLWLIQN